MSPGNQIFLIGPGFIGGEVLDILLQESYEITVLVRRQAAAEELEKLGVKTVKGSLADSEIIARQAFLSDIVIHTATADDLVSVEAVIQGITRRVENGSTAIYIHTSGAGLLGDNSEGSFESQNIFEDDKPEEIDAVSDEAQHRKIDLAIVNASRSLGPKAKLAIMIPPLIYGVSSREKRLSIQLPTLIRFAIKHGYSGHIGNGLSKWSQVHVRDLARGYVTLLHSLQNNQMDVQNPYFFCSNGKDLSWADCAVEIGKILYQEGKIESPEPRSIPRELYTDLFGPDSSVVVGSNSRIQANRLRHLGWEPREKGTLASLLDEIPITIREQGHFSGYSGFVGSEAQRD
ncbi:NAD dependent epimerase/dehydratase family protein [Sclerotinia borealis F-4128]|uniref:NAD dependent epimerase/dehydratase family protein n=1 Tax=Sclerotinia borealis (strain F-4128) TaxID=1432307 RepID=W9CBH7_SCLBF|nr:NAD dependent epimerase/dehydratase family protein [Sclerotinia borealis F-4128]